MWTSPLTGRTMFGCALLTPDLQRAGWSRSQHRERLLTSPPWDRFVRGATTFFGCVPLLMQAECQRLVTGADAPGLLARIRAEPEPWCVAWLDLCWRAGRIDLFPTDLLDRLVTWERTSIKTPLVQRLVWRSLLQQQSDAAQVSADNRENLLKCRRHILWRLKCVDGVFVPESRSPIDRSLLFARCAWTAPADESLQWTRAGRAQLRTPCMLEHERCLYELDETNVTLRILQQGRTVTEDTFKSRQPLRMRGQRLWRSRRIDQPPFPDSTGSDSSSEEESPHAQDSFIASLGGHALSILEKPLLALPMGFEYVPRLHAEDLPVDDAPTLTRAAAVLTESRRRASTSLPERRVKPRLELRTRSQPTPTPACHAP